MQATMGRIVGVFMAVLCLGATLSSGASAAKPACTDTYQGSGDWFDAASWSAARVPVASDSVCLTGSSAVSIGNDSVTVANLSMSWARAS